MAAKNDKKTLLYLGLLKGFIVVFIGFIVVL